MKEIYTRKTLPVVFSFACFIAVAAAGHAHAGVYYAYQDANGHLVLSNNPPPPGSKIIKTETLPEVTDQQIAEAQARDEAAAFDNRLSSLENAVGGLTGNLSAQSPAATSAPQGYGDDNIAVGVTSGPTIIRRQPRRPITRPPNSRNDFPNREPGDRAPAPPQPRTPGRTG